MSRKRGKAGQTNYTYILRVCRHLTRPLALEASTLTPLYWDRSRVVVEVCAAVVVERQNIRGQGRGSTSDSNEVLPLVDPEVQKSFEPVVRGRFPQERVNTCTTWEEVWNTLRFRRPA